MNKAEQARRLYVSGEADTIAEANRRVGYNGRSLYDVAKKDNWKADREEHQYQKTVSYLKADRESCAEHARNLRSNSMVAAHKAMASLLQRLTEGELEPSPAGTKQIVDMALALAAANVGETDEAKDALSALSLDELVAQAAVSLQALAGPTQN